MNALNTFKNYVNEKLSLVKNNDCFFQIEIKNSQKPLLKDSVIKVKFLRLESDKLIAFTTYTTKINKTLDIGIVRNILKNDIDSNSFKKIINEIL